MILCGFWAGPVSDSGTEPSVGELIEGGRLDDLRQRIENGMPPEALLMAAVRRDSAEALRLAFESGADPRGVRASRALLRARRHELGRAADTLTRAGVDLDGRDKLGRTLLILALQDGDASRVRTLIEEGADLDARSNVGVTALMEAVVAERLRNLKALVEAGAEVDAVDRDGWTALQWAVRQDNVEAARFLLLRGADPNHVDRLGWTPLLLAAADGKATLAYELLKRGALPRLDTPTVGSPLVRAVHGGSADVVRLLLAFGADRRAVFAGRTALEWAWTLKRNDLAGLLAARRHR